LSDLNADAKEMTDPDYLLRLRKKLLAEFNLSNSSTIDINGKPYSKDEVIKTIDVLLGNPLMPLHSFIFANKSLLDFLENDASRVRLQEFRDLVVPEEIKPMLSPVMLERIGFNLKKAFHTRNFDAATELLTWSPDLSEHERAMLNEEISRNVLNLQEHIQSVRMNGSANILKDLDYLKKNSLAILLNKLPADFIDTINSFVGEVINAMVSYQKVKGHDRAYLYYVSTNLCKIKCDEELMKLVKANHLVFTQNYEGRSSGSSSSGEKSGGDISAGRIIYIILIVAVFLIRVATCSRHSNSSSYNYNNLNLSSDFYKSLNKEKSEYDEFNTYRKYVQHRKTYPSALARYDDLAPVDSSISGDNPFLYVLKRDSRYDYEDTSLRRVLIKNTSGYDLIITVFNEYYSRAQAYYFFNGKPDTLSFSEGDKVCLYFGDSLSLKSSSGSTYATTVLKAQYDVYFRDVKESAYDILEKDYTIELKQKQKKSKKKKKKTPVPAIEIRKDFFQNDRFENEKVKLSAQSPYQEEISDPPPVQGEALEEVSITPK
jgi:hypothetical protein